MDTLRKNENVAAGQAVIDAKYAEEKASNEASGFGDNMKKRQNMPHMLLKKI